MQDSEQYFLDLIKRYRRKKQMNQNDLAKKLNMPRTTYQAIESGRNHLKLEDFARIVNILQIPLGDFEDSDCYVLRLSKEDIEDWVRIMTKINNTIEIMNEKKKTKTEITIKTKGKI